MSTLSNHGSIVSQVASQCSKSIVSPGGKSSPMELTVVEI